MLIFASVSVASHYQSSGLVTFMQFKQQVGFRMLPGAFVLTYRIPLILMEDLAVTAVHVGHVNGVAICPIDFPVWAGVR